MKPITKTNRIFAVLIILLINTSCKYERNMVYKEIAKQTSNHISSISGPLLFSIDTIIILEADKNRNGLIISHDNTSLGVVMSVINNTDSSIKIIVREDGKRLQSNFSGYIHLNMTLDSFSLVNYSIPDSITLKPYNTYSATIWSSFYDFEKLFQKKKDYTQDMLHILDHVYLKYKWVDDTNDSIHQILFLPNNDTKYYSYNSYAVAVWPFWDD